MSNTANLSKEVIRGLVVAVKKADDACTDAGIDENTNSWVRDYFLPELEEMGLTIVSAQELKATEERVREEERANLTKKINDMKPAIGLGFYELGVVSTQDLLEVQAYKNAIDDVLELLTPKNSPQGEE